MLRFLIELSYSLLLFSWFCCDFSVRSREKTVELPTCGHSMRSQNARRLHQHSGPQLPHRACETTNQCLHGLTLVRKSSLERLLNRHSRQQAAYQKSMGYPCNIHVADGLDASEGCPNRVALSIGGHRATAGDPPCSGEGIPGKRNLPSHSTGR